MGSRHSTEASRASPIIYKPVASAIAVVQGVAQGGGDVVMTELRDFSSFVISKASSPAAAGY